MSHQEQKNHEQKQHGGQDFKPNPKPNSGQQTKDINPANKQDNEQVPEQAQQGGNTSPLNRK